MPAQSYRIVLAGNPNVGKSTLFNALTGAKQHVANWPGKTVEKKEGRVDIQGRECFVVDLPGTYSLTAYSIEEIISRDYLIDEKPNAVVAVVDASNLERNLYLVVQLLELEVPVILALNMTDIAHKRGLNIDPAALSASLGGVPVIETTHGQLNRVEQLKAEINRLDSAPRPLRVDYGPALEIEIAALAQRIEASPALAARYTPRWLAVQLLEDDDNLIERLRAEGGHDDLIDAAALAAARIDEASGEEAATLIADRRYQFIAGIVRGTVVRGSSAAETFSDRVDLIVTHRIWGVPIFLLLMWVVFQFTANVSAPFVEFTEMLFEGPVTRWMVALLAVLGLGDTWVESLAVDGIIAGVGGVLVFVPVLFALYLALAVLEDSGYMARSAFVMDRFMTALGLHGKSFLPMMVGFGCTVPAIYATRTLDNETDRKITAFLTPFMSCGARLPVYVLFGTIFFGSNSGTLIFAMYVTGIVVALLTSLLLTKVIYRGRVVPPLVIELPPYRLPALRTVGRDIRRRVGSFVHNAGTIILAAAVVLWFMLSIPASGSLNQFNDVELEDSVFSAISRGVAPALAPAGFGTWEASGALVTGLIAKEVVIATMNQIYTGEDDEEAIESTFVEDLGEIATGFGEAVILTGQEVINIVPRTLNLLPGLSLPDVEFLAGEDEEIASSSLEQALRSAFTPLAAVAFTVFILLYVPCMAAVGAMRQEFGWRWALIQAGYMLLVAWAAAVIVYQGGQLLGWGVA